MSSSNWKLHNAECSLDDLHDTIESLNLSDEDKQICYSGIAMVSGILARNKDRLEEEFENEMEAYEAETEAIYHELDQTRINNESEEVERPQRVVKVNAKRPNPGTHEAYMASKVKESNYEC